MNNARKFVGAILLLWLIPALSACSGGNPHQVGLTNSKLTPCPSSPNCFSSDASDPDHFIKPFLLKSATTDVWETTLTQVTTLPRTVIISADESYLHAECRSALFGFADDLELHYRPEEKIIAVRSASRLGHSDFGVNRKRVEELRSTLVMQKIIESSY